MTGISPVMEGKELPDVTFKVYRAGGFEDWKIRERCAGKTVIIFGLPGAFTPTCSSSHLPRYEELFPTFKKLGVDEIYCLSVNDTFVMNTWAEHNELKHVIMLPDGNGEFTQAMHLLVDKSAIGFGKRSWRYSMLIRNNVIEKMFLEPEEGSDPYGVSDADTILKYLDPKIVPPPRIAILTKPNCSFCAKAKVLLQSKGLHFAEVPLPDSIRHIALGAMTGKQTVPQVWVDGKYLGGSEEVEKWVASLS